MVQGTEQNFDKIGQKLTELDVIADILPTHIVYPSEKYGPYGLNRCRTKFRRNRTKTNRVGCYCLHIAYSAAPSIISALVPSGCSLTLFRTKSQVAALSADYVCIEEVIPREIGSPDGATRFAAQ